MIGELSNLRSQPPWNAERITVPVIALHGEHGQEHHRIGTQRLAEMLPNATWRTVPDARHFGPNTHPDEIAEIVIEFVDRVAG